MASVRIKRGDTHSLTFVISGTGIVDLTGASGQIHVRSKAGVVVTQTVTLAGTTAVWQLDGLLAAGVYDIEIELTVAGKVSTAPSNGYLRLVVESDLA